MKTLFAALIALVSATNAFALSPSEISKTLATADVQEALKGATIEKIEAGPSPRCMGCFTLNLTTYNYASQETQTYHATGMDFGGQFRLQLRKMN